MNMTFLLGCWCKIWHRGKGKIAISTKRRQGWLLFTGMIWTCVVQRVFSECKSKYARLLAPPVVCIELFGFSSGYMLQDSSLYPHIIIRIVM